MADEESPIEITFSKKVDTDGRMVVPQEHREALTIEGREALVEFTAKKITYLDDDEGDQ
jgi:bifunctional DNA-binding transcriptional regulator/antitoxin component of YhaV-PrlF toxin-antitoxin module